MEKVDGRERYEVLGIQAEEIIADVMERVESAEGFGMAQAWDVGNAIKYLLRAGRKDALSEELGKAENYLHHACTGRWIGEKDIRHSRTDSLGRIADELEAAVKWCDQNGSYGTGISSVTESTLREWADRIRKLAKDDR